MSVLIPQGTWYFTGACAGSMLPFTGGEYTPIQSLVVGVVTPLHDTLTHDPEVSSSVTFTDITILLSVGIDTFTCNFLQCKLKAGGVD